MVAGVMRRRALGGAVAGLACGPTLVRAAVLRARIPRPPRNLDLERFYPLQLLRAALQASGQAFEIELSAQPIIQARALRELAADSGVTELQNPLLGPDWREDPRFLYRPAAGRSGGVQ